MLSYVFSGTADDGGVRKRDSNVGTLGTGIVRVFLWGRACQKEVGRYRL